MRYDPAQPQEAVLEAVTPKMGGTLAIAVLSLILGLAGGALFVAMGMGLL